MHPDQVLKGNTCRYFVGWVEFSTASQGQKKICTMSKLFSCIICLSVEYEIYHDSTYYSLYLLLVFNHKIHLAELSESCISYLRGVQKKLSEQTKSSQCPSTYMYIVSSDNWRSYKAPQLEVVLCSFNEDGVS